jgi:AmmeMemoRadiSam system protein B
LTRKPSAVYFYPQEKKALIETLDGMLENLGLNVQEAKYDKQKPHSRGILGGVSPHAGYIFSGIPAAKLMAAVAKDGKPDTFIVLGPRHDGMSPSSVMVHGDWLTPLGVSSIDQELAQLITDNSEYLVENDRAHQYEHSIEVQIPFLQYFFGEISFVPIAVAGRDRREMASIGLAIAKASTQLSRDIVIIASTDMTHYGSAYGYAPIGDGPVEDVLRFMRESDGKAIDHILKLKPKNLLEYVQESGITMCGSGPVASMLFATLELGAKTTQKIMYTTSWDAKVGPRSTSQIVGYFSAVIGR